MSKNRHHPYPDEFLLGLNDDISEQAVEEIADLMEAPGDLIQDQPVHPEFVSEAMPTLSKMIERVRKRRKRVWVRKSDIRNEMPDHVTDDEFEKYWVEKKQGNLRHRSYEFGHDGEEEAISAGRRKYRQQEPEDDTRGVDEILGNFEDASDFDANQAIFQNPAMNDSFFTGLADPVNEASFLHPDDLEPESTTAMAAINRNPSVFDRAVDEAKKTTFKTGDIVRHKSSFLKSISWLTDVPSYGEVTKVGPGHSGAQYVHVKWFDHSKRPIKNSEGTYDPSMILSSNIALHPHHGGKPDPGRLREGLDEASGKLYALVYGDGSLYGATDDRNGNDYERYWMRAVSQDEEDETWAIYALQGVPDSLDKQLIDHGTSDQHFSDGYEAWNAAKKYAKSAVDSSDSMADAGNAKLHGLPNIKLREGTIGRSSKVERKPRPKGDPQEKLELIVKSMHGKKLTLLEILKTLGKFNVSPHKDSLSSTHGSTRGGGARTKPASDELKLIKAMAVGAGSEPRLSQKKGWKVEGGTIISPDGDNQYVIPVVTPGLSWKEAFPEYHQREDIQVSEGTLTHPDAESDDLVAKSLKVANNKQLLMKRFKETISVMKPNLRKLFGKDAKFDFKKKRLIGTDDKNFLQFMVRKAPHKPISGSNQQTSQGYVAILALKDGVDFKEMDRLLRKNGYVHENRIREEMHVGDVKIPNKYIIATRDLKPGKKVEVVFGSGVDSGTKGVIVRPNEAPRDLIDGKSGGEYKPFNASKEVVIKTDKGKYIRMFKSRLVEPHTRLRENITEGRHFEADEWPAFFSSLEGESSGYPNWQNPDDDGVTRKLKAAAKKFTDEAHKATGEYCKKNAGELAPDVSDGDFYNDEWISDVLLTLEGHGAGIWDGDWDHLFVKGNQGIRKIQDFLMKRLSRAHNTIMDVIRNSAYETMGGKALDDAQEKAEKWVNTVLKKKAPTAKITSSNDGESHFVTMKFQDSTDAETMATALDDILQDTPDTVKSWHIYPLRRSELNFSLRLTEEKISESKADDLKKAEKRGREAFGLGIKSAPMNDKVFYKKFLVPNNGPPGHNDGIMAALMKAWSRGWTKENLATNKVREAHISLHKERVDEFKCAHVNVRGIKNGMTVELAGGNVIKDIKRKAPRDNSFSGTIVSLGEKSKKEGKLKVGSPTTFAVAHVMQVIKEELDKVDESVKEILEAMSQVYLGGTLDEVQGRALTKKKDWLGWGDAVKAITNLKKSVDAGDLKKAANAVHAFDLPEGVWGSGTVISKRMDPLLNQILKATKNSSKWDSEKKKIQGILAELLKKAQEFAKRPELVKAEEGIREASQSVYDTSMYYAQAIGQPVNDPDAQSAALSKVYAVIKKFDPNAKHEEAGWNKYYISTDKKLSRGIQAVLKKKGWKFNGIGDIWTVMVPGIGPHGTPMRETKLSDRQRKIDEVIDPASRDTKYVRELQIRMNDSRKNKFSDYI